MKNIFIIYCSLLSFYTAQAQGKVELKADVLAVFESAVEVSGEYLLASRWGIEAGVGYQAYKYINDAYTSTVKSKFINTYIAGKYYFKPKHGGDRFFVGAVANYYVFLSNTVRGQQIEKPDNAIIPGIEPGYKWLLKERFIIELSARFLLENKDFVYEDREGYINVLVNGRIGYRF